MTGPLEGDRADFDEEMPRVCELCGLRWCDCEWPGIERAESLRLAQASVSEAIWWREVAA